MCETLWTNGRQCLWRGHSVDGYRPLIPGSDPLLVFFVFAGLGCLRPVCALPPPAGVACSCFSPLPPSFSFFFDAPFLGGRFPASGALGHGTGLLPRAHAFFPFPMGRVVCADPGVPQVDRFPDFFQPVLESAGYDGVFGPKGHAPGLRYGFYSDGTALFWRRDAFAPDAPPEVLYCRERDGRPGNRPYIIGALRSLRTSGAVLVGATHLKAKPGATNEAARVHDISQVLALPAPPFASQAHYATQTLLRDGGGGAVPSRKVGGGSG